MDLSSSLLDWDNYTFLAQYRKEEHLQWTSQGCFESKGDLLVKYPNNLEPGSNYRVIVLPYIGASLEGISAEKFVQTKALPLGKFFMFCGASQTKSFLNFVFKAVSNTHRNGNGNVT